MNLTHSELALDLGTVTLNCTTEELGAALAGLLHEMHTAAPFIHPEEREALRRIMIADGTVTVADVFPDFARNSEAHNTLRKLRTAQFIRPADRDRWDADERIEIKPFARLLWDRVGEGRIFGDLSEPVEEIDLALPEMNEPESAPAPKVKKKGSEWDEADVLDFLSDDTKD